MGMRGPGALPMKERKLRPDFVEREQALKVLARQDAKAALVAEVMHPEYPCAHCISSAGGLHRSAGDRWR
jgi:hypothetical protein